VVQNVKYQIKLIYSEMLSFQNNLCTSVKMQTSHISTLYIFFGLCWHQSPKRGRLKGKLSERKSPAGWRSAPALNPKMRRGLGVLLTGKENRKNTRTHEVLEWFGPPERNTLLHCVMYCLCACMSL
jgi:hypothetical protein